MKHAAIYRRNDKLVLHPDGQTTTGVYITIGPFVVLPASSDAAAIGAAARRVLAASRQGLPHPQPHEWKAIGAPLYAAAGVKSWSTFVKGAVLANVESAGGAIRVLPQVNLGARDGFQPEGLPAIEIPEAATDAELGAAVLNALEIAGRK